MPIRDVIGYAIGVAVIIALIWAMFHSDDDWNEPLY